MSSTGPIRTGSSSRSTRTRTACTQAGPLTVTISNTQNDKTFDWSSNIGVDAVFVKAGSGGSYLYRYDPPGEETSDTGLTSSRSAGERDQPHLLLLRRAVKIIVESRRSRRRPAGVRLHVGLHEELRARGRRAGAVRPHPARVRTPSRRASPRAGSRRPRRAATARARTRLGLGRRGRQVHVHEH